MSVKAIQPSLTPKQNLNAEKKHQSNNVAFQGSFNPVVTLMDAIDRGGFAASFIAQDGIGMVAPRIWEGLNRNRKIDEETGKKTGPLNWEFARREGIREILSGPSAFLIPAGILAIIKKSSGKANNIPIDLINTYGENFAKLAKDADLLKDTGKAKSAFYEMIFKNALETSTDGALKGKELEAAAKKYTDKLLEIEKAKGKNFFKNIAGTRVEGSRQDLTGDLVKDFMDLRKKYTAPSNNELVALLKPEGKDKTVGTSIGRLLSSIGEYADDAIKHTQKHLEKGSKEGVEEFIKKFNLRRSGTRVMSNFGMWLAVVGFYTLIPKLYNLGIKKDPGLAGLEDDTHEETNSQTAAKDGKKDVNFTGGFQSIAAKTGENVLKPGAFNKIAGKFEFNGASMSVPAMMALLFGFCFPPRYMNAKSDHERKEIVFRDLLSFGAILFGAKALSRATSKMFSKLSGLALNTKPADHGKSFINKLKNYFSPGAGIDVLTSDRIVSKYSKVDGYKGGIIGFFDFIKENGGNVKKLLHLDKNVRANAETILEQSFGKTKTMKTASEKEILDAFKKAEGTDALKNIYKAFEKPNNKFVNIAKTCNSAFGFLSTLVLVPAFMIWVARTCENMTKQRVAKEKAEKAAAQSITEQVKPQNQPSVNVAIQHLTAKPSMAGFLGTK